MFVSGNQKVRYIEAFKSVVDIVDDFHSSDDIVKFSVGGYYGVHADFTRIGGKKLVTSNSTNGGAVLSLGQLSFTDRTIFISHSSTAYNANTYLELACLRVPNTSTTVLGPIIPPP